MKSKFTWIFTLLLAFFVQFAFAQQKQVSGVVTDETGMPAPGVTIMVKENSAIAPVITDVDGKYTISAEQGQTLVFTFFQTKREVVVGASSSYNVVMDTTEVLEETVITTNYKKAIARPLINDAITTINAATINNRPNASFIQTLQGQVPGLNISSGSGQPGANSTVIIRGLGSINGNVEPLYIIDGVPMNSDNFRSINPNDIANIAVLKDSGATAIYGNRGANGVIVVTTKKGSFESPLAISYSGISSFTQMQNNKYDVMSSSEILSLENQVGRGYGATLTESEIANFSGANTNWKKEIFRTGLSQNHTLNLSSGGKNLTSFTSIGFFDQEGILENTGLKRFNFRNNMSGKSDNEKFEYTTGLTINYSRRSEATQLGTGAVNLNPVVGANSGLPYLSPANYTNGQDLFDWYTGNASNDPAAANGIPSTGLSLTPLMLLNQLETYSNRTDEIKMVGNLNARYRVTDDITAGASLGTDYTQATGLYVYDPASFTELIYQGTGQDYLGSQQETFAREVSFTVNTSLNYNKVFDEKHTLDVSVFTEYYKAHQKSFGYVQNGLDPKVFSPGNGAGFIGFDSDFPTYYRPSVSSGKATAGLFSYFATADYDYSAKYGASASIRRDASYRFAQSNRWGTFWSVSGRWNIDQEEFMQGSKFNMLKLRGSYGTTGNQNILGQSIFNYPNGTRTLYDLISNSYSNLPAYALTQLGNADLKWETTRQIDLGVDFEVFDRSLRGTVDVYNKKTIDLFLTLPVSGVNGTYGIPGNNGDLTNKGVELMLSYDVFDTPDFKLTLNFNGSYNKNEVVRLPNGEDQESDLTMVSEGHPLNEFYAIKYAGVNPANGNLLFYTADGQLTENPDPDTDKRYTGKTFFPKYQGGFGFDASYKGFFLTTQFSYVADIWRFDYDLESLQDPNSIGQYNMSKDLLNAWTPENRTTDIPAIGLTNKSSDTFSDRYLKDASYVRLRFASFGYNFNREWLQNTPFSNIRAYVMGENLFTLTKWRGWDAESNRAGDNYQYPTPRILSVGLEVGF